MLREDFILKEKRRTKKVFLSRGDFYYILAHVNIYIYNVDIIFNLLIHKGCVNILSFTRGTITNVFFKSVKYV